MTGTMRATHLSTAAVGDGAEFDYWADAVSSTFVPLECSLGQDGFGAAFHADLVNVRVGEVQFTRITAAAHRVLRTRRMIARSDVGQYKIGLQLDGVGWRLELGPGEPDGVRGARLLAVQAWIERNLSRPELSPETVAAANHISVRYLYRLFETEGTTVARWIKERRLEGCRRELADSSLARYGVSAIGARWGLLDPASFSRAFRAAYGVSPREYRASRTAVGTR